MVRKWVWMATGVGLFLAVFSGDVFAEDRSDQGPPAPDRNWQVSFTPSYSSGNFGTATTTNFYYAPLTIKRLFRDGDVSFVLPMVCLTSNGQVTQVGGQPVRIDDRSGSNSGPGGGGSGRATGRATGSAVPVAAPGPGSDGTPRTDDDGNPISPLSGQLLSQRSTNCGIGDLVFRGRYYVVEERDWIPLIAVTGRIKVPTADADRALGTGKWDEGVGAEVSKFLGDKWLAFLDGGFNIIGRPEGLNLRNQWWYDVGAGYYWTNSLVTSVYFEEYRSLVSGLQNIRDIFISTNYTASEAWRFNGGVTFGVSNGAPDYMLSVGASYRF